MAHGYKEVGSLRIGDLVYVNDRETEPLATPAGWPLDPDYVDRCPTVAVTKLTRVAAGGGLVKINDLPGLYRTDVVVPVPVEPPD